MFRNIIFMFFSLLIFTVWADSNFHFEEDCGRNGGNACVYQSECPQIDTKISGFCQNQKKDGAICCKNYPIEKFNCKHLHNDCMESNKCKDTLNLGQKGCPTGKVCCQLV